MSLRQNLERFDIKSFILLFCMLTSSRFIALLVMLVNLSESPQGHLFAASIDCSQAVS